MTSRASTPSDGEIVELSDSQKANKTQSVGKHKPVDRPNRKRATVSRSPSPIYPQRSRDLRFRSRSRSPYRASRDSKPSKRPHGDDHYDKGQRSGSGRSDKRYDGDRLADRRPSQRSHGDHRHESGQVGRGRDYDRNYLTTGREKRLRTASWSRSPPRFSNRDGSSHPAQDDMQAKSQDEKHAGDLYRDLGGGSREQPVSDWGHTLAAAAKSKAYADRSNDQARRNGSEKLGRKSEAENSIGAVMDNGDGPSSNSLVDDTVAIEQRRKRREAILAKHRTQTTPLLVQALNISAEQASTTSRSNTEDALHSPIDSPRESPPQTPRDGSNPGSPAAFDFEKDEELANEKSQAVGDFQEDEPSAADYDPTMDMEEDKLRSSTRNQGEVPSGTYDETRFGKQDVLIPQALADAPTPKLVKDEFDMFAEDEDGDEDMFADAPVAPVRREAGDDDVARAIPVPRAKALDMSMLDDWDDEEGYYKVILGELLEGRYHVQANLGRGMFSGVVRAMDQASAKLVAIKIIRNNETMRKAAAKEIDILQKLIVADPEDKKHCIRLERFFEHKGHLCMVFENLSINLREVLKKFGRDVGINLKAVRIYAQQMFLGLSLLRKCNILHADLKPDNVLVNEARSLLKICDLGSASDASENEITPYLVSRFYRAPEIILGMPYDFAIDMWSVGCTLFELYTGKILFTGRSNNQMLRSIMECRGRFSHKILRKAEFAGLHFDDMLNFRSLEKDKLTGKDVVRMMTFTKPTRDLRTRLMANVTGMAEGDTKELNLFLDLLERCLNLNPERRCTPSEALKHPFILRARP